LIYLAAGQREAPWPEVTVKIGPAIDKEFVEVAKESGQSQRYLLEKAIEHHIHNVAPS
jgi:predicted transcriptional regulator